MFIKSCPFRLWLPHGSGQGVCLFCWRFPWCSDKGFFLPIFLFCFVVFVCFLFVWSFVCLFVLWFLVLVLDFFVHGLKKLRWRYLAAACERILQLLAKEVASPLTAVSWDEDTRSDPSIAALLWLLLPGERWGGQRTINIGHFFCLPLSYHNLPL